jgi:coenzyme PQQ biosynthesis protein B
VLLRILGTAAGGGLPQWNCACPGWPGAGAHPQRRRRHASLAARTNSGRWYLVNATPDLGEQIESCTDLHPVAGTRDTPVTAVLQGQHTSTTTSGTGVTTPPFDRVRDQVRQVYISDRYQAMLAGLVRSAPVRVSRTVLDAVPTQ